jgi:hypothetical protein
MAGDLIVEASGAVSPGTGTIGKLSVGKGITLGSQAFYSADLNAKTGEADLIQAGGTIKLNGILYITRTSQEAYTAGNQFKILSAPAINDSFQMIIPASPGQGLQWDLSELNTRGILKVTPYTGISSREIPALLLYPNPVRDKLTVDASGLRGEILIALYDAAGDVLLFTRVEGGKITEIPVIHFPRGIYVARATTNDHIFLHKIIK